MKKQLLVGLALGLFLVATAGIAMAVDETVVLQIKSDAENAKNKAEGNDGKITGLHDNILDLQNQIDSIELTPGPQGPTGPQGPAGPGSDCPQCTQEELGACYSGAPTGIGIGECKSGFRTCLNDGTWGDCVGETLPQEEICNNELDDDCDGLAGCADDDCVNATNCLPPSSECDPLTQNCTSETDACFINVSQDIAICVVPFPEEGNENPGQQGDICTYINTCEKGYSCAGATLEVPNGLTCAYVCDASGSGGPACGDPGGPGSQYTCIAINDFWANAENLSDEWGICVMCDDFPGEHGCP